MILRTQELISKEGPQDKKCRSMGALDEGMKRLRQLLTNVAVNIVIKQVHNFVPNTSIEWETSGREHETMSPYYEKKTFANKYKLKIITHSKNTMGGFFRWDFTTALSQRHTVFFFCMHEKFSLTCSTLAVSTSSVSSPTVRFWHNLSAQ